MIAVATPSCVVLFDYAQEEPVLCRVYEKPNVTYITFNECHMILCMENEDSDDVTLACFELEGDEPYSKITIKRFLSQQIMLRPGYESIHYATGK